MVTFLCMKAVGIKVLKAKLSEYVRMAKAGETILVTERDEVVAELGPARRQPLSPESVEERLRRLAEVGEVSLASRDLASWNGFPGERLEGVSSEAILDGLRGDDP